MRATDAAGPGSPRPAVASEPGGGPSGLWAPGYRALTWGLVLTVTLVAFESLSVVTILPVVVRDLGDLRLYGWVTSAFFLGTLVGIVVAGAATDRRGPAAPFVAGLCLFAVGLTVGGLAPTMYVLVAGRAVQGLGAGAVPAIAYATIGRSFPASLRPRMFATLSTAWVVPGLGGPALAALVAAHAGWRAVFLGLLPLVLASGSAVLPALRRLGAPSAAGGDGTAGGDGSARGRGPAGRTPLVAALRVSAGAGLILAGVTTRSLVGVPFVLVGAAIGVRPLRRILPDGTLRARRGVPAAVATRGLLTFAFFGADTFVPLAFTSARHTSTTIAGVAVSVATLLWTTGSWTQARLAARATSRRLAGIGLAIVVAGLGGTAAGLSGAVPLPAAIAAWGLAGFGIGLAYAPIALVVLAAAPAEGQGAASTGLQLSDNLGTALGSGLTGVVVAATHAAGWEAAAGLRAAFALAGAAGIAGIVTARRMPATTIPATDDP
jgi:MFS family permease